MAEYIDKQKFIDELDDKYSLGDIGRMEHDIIVDALLYAKPADVRPVVKGHWKEGKVYTFGDIIDKFPCECSVCGRTALGEPWFFCPNCGADMRGTQDE